MNTRREIIKNAALTATGMVLGAISSREATASTQQPVVQNAPLPESAQLLSGKVALITGAARGIGLAFSKAFVQNGAAVVMFDIADPNAVPPYEGFRLATEEEFEKAFESVRSINSKVIKVKGDVRNLADLEKAVSLAKAKFGGLDTAIANAGYVRWHSFMEGTELDWKTVIDINVHGVFNTFKAAVPAMRERSRGNLIAISSVGGRQAAAGNGAYTASKWAVIGMVKQAAFELGSYNIAVNAIAPGAVNTPMYRSEGQMRSMNASSAHEQDKILRPMYPLGEPVLDPSEIADTAVFLSSNAARGMSGAVLDVARGYNSIYTA